MDPKQIQLGIGEQLPEMKKYSTNTLQVDNSHMQLKMASGGRQCGTEGQTTGFDVSQLEVGILALAFVL